MKQMIQLNEDCAISNGWVFYFDEIKPVIQVKGEL